jgi:tetratricopeptide (TPR) repeat protein
MWYVIERRVSSAAQINEPEDISMGMKDHVVEITEGRSHGSEMLPVPETRALSMEVHRWFEQGMAQLQVGKAKDAVASLSRSVECAPDFPEGHMFLGVAHAMSSSVYPAFDHLERATELAPDSFAGHYLVAQLNFKLRIPQKGYAAAERALQCARLPQERRLLAELLQKERERKHNGLSRPWFNKPFRTSSLVLLGGGLGAAMFVVILHLVLASMR